MSSRYSQAIRFRTVEAAIQLLIKAGCEVSETRSGDYATLSVHICPDPKDIHGARLQDMLNA